MHLPDRGRAMPGVLEGTRHGHRRNRLQRHAVAVGVDAGLKGVKTMADGVAAGQTRRDRTNGLFEAKTVGGQRVGGGRMQ